MKDIFESKTNYRGKGRLVYGVGLNDLPDKTISAGQRDNVYMKWKGMLYRVYSKSSLKRCRSYSETTVCDSWLRLSNFKEWYVSQIGFDLGYEIDKDLLFKCNNIYSPDTCVLVPPEINKFLIGRPLKKENLPIGVHKHKTGKYKAQINEGGKRVCLITTDSIEEAEQAYIERKKVQARSLAIKYKGLVDSRVYDALINYEV